MSRTILVPIGVLTAGVLLLVGCETTYTDNDITAIPQSQVRALSLEAATDPKAVLLIDARSAAAFAREHIVGATNLQLYDLDPDRPRLRRLDGFGDLVVYGDDPGSTTAPALAKRLMKLEYEPVKWYKGGLLEWKAAGFPTEVSDPKAPEAK